jgi:hypothetical protein
MQAKHKYRVQVYLGKELYERLEEMAKFMGVPISTATKLILNTGFEFGTMMEKAVLKNVVNNLGESNAKE